MLQGVLHELVRLSSTMSVGGSVRINRSSHADKDEYHNLMTWLTESRGVRVVGAVCGGEERSCASCFAAVSVARTVAAATYSRGE